MTIRKSIEKMPSPEKIRAFLSSQLGPCPVTRMKHLTELPVSQLRCYLASLAKDGELVASHDKFGRWQYGLPIQIEGLADVYAPTLPAEYTSRVVHGMLS